MASNRKVQMKLKGLLQDIMTIPEAEIPTTEVVYTIVGGEVKYRRGGE